MDQHFLFHVLLMPFTFGDLRLGAKLAAPLFSAIAIASIFALLVAYRIRYRWLWLLAARRGFRAVSLPHVHDARSQPSRSSCLPWAFT